MWDNFQIEVAKRVEELRLEYPNKDYPSFYAEHMGDECVECEALVFLHYEKSLNQDD